MANDLAIVRRIIRDLDLLPGQTPARTPIIRLGGLTNRVYRIGAGDTVYGPRRPGKGTV